MHDMNQAIAILSTFHHWTIQTENRVGKRYSHSCTIWDRSEKRNRRVTGQGRTPLLAVTRAMDKLKDKTTGTALKIVS